MPTVIEGITFYRLSEVAKALRVTPQTIRAYIKQGRLKSQRIGRPILITEDNLREFLKPPPKKGTLAELRERIYKEAKILTSKEA